MNFLLDSGSSGALITSELRETLGLTPLDGQVGRKEGRVGGVWLLGDRKAVTCL